MEGFENFCPACMIAIEKDEPVVFFEREMYHLDCVPGSRYTPPPREPRF